MKEQFRRRRLPHLDKPGAIYFVTTCLAGSVPALGMLEIADYRQRLAERDRPEEMTEQQWRQHKWKLEFAKADQWLDRSLAIRHLETADLAEIAEQSLLHFSGERFAIWAWVVMPNHIHFVFEPLFPWVDSLGDTADERTPRERIMHSVKRHSARQCNRKLEITGSCWQDESYDHCVEDVDELERVIQYVERNPVKAGLVTDTSEYRFSSSKYRKENGIPCGRPLIGKTHLNALE